MKKVLVVVVILFFLLAVGSIAFYYTVGSSWQQRQTEQVSEAQQIKDTVRVAGDNYFGYWFIQSSEFKQRLAQKGYALEWTNDGGIYADRLQKFRSGAYDLIVLPVNSYIQHGQPNPYPGVIVAALSDSKGADSIVGYQDKLIGGENRPVRINDLNRVDLTIAATTDSPSSFLLDCAIVDFGLDKLKAKTQKYLGTDSSQDALKKLENKEVDVAVLWEPNVSQALEIPGVVSVFGSDQIAGMIIDVFVAKNESLVQKPEMIEAFFEAYFETLSFYGTNKEAMIEEINKITAFKTEEAANKALERIAWFGLRENHEEWFNQAEKIIRTIIQVGEVMKETGEVTADPLQGNPYRIINKQVLENVYRNVAPESIQIGATSLTGTFSVLSDAAWSKLHSIGTLRVLPITFDASTSRLTTEGAGVVDEAAKLLVYNFPQYRIMVRGHTAPSGDELANVALSQERADLVRNYLIQKYNLDPNRIKAIGLGSSEPLVREPNEPERSWRNRLARVEFILLED